MAEGCHEGGRLGHPDMWKKQSTPSGPKHSCQMGGCEYGGVTGHQQAPVEDPLYPLTYPCSHLGQYLQSCWPSKEVCGLALEPWAGRMQLQRLPIGHWDCHWSKGFLLDCCRQGCSAVLKPQLEWLHPSSLLFPLAYQLLMGWIRALGRPFLNSVPGHSPQPAWEDECLMLFIARMLLSTSLGSPTHRLNDWHLFSDGIECTNGLSLWTETKTLLD